jgi:hypothetical protein
VTGDLTIHGVTKPVVLKVDLLGFGPGMMGAQLSGWDASVTLNRRDFGVNGPAMLGKALGDRRGRLDHGRGRPQEVSPDELQALIEEATFDYVIRRPRGRPREARARHRGVARLVRGLACARGDKPRAAPPGRCPGRGRAGPRAPEGRPLAIATLSRTWMERGDKARAEHFGAMARVQSWKEELAPLRARCRRVALRRRAAR